MFYRCTSLFFLLFVFFILATSKSQENVEHYFPTSAAQPTSRSAPFLSSNRDILDTSSFIAEYHAKGYIKEAREASSTDDGNGALEAIRLLQHAYSLYPQESTRKDITRLALRISRDYSESIFESTLFKDSLNAWMDMDDLAYEEMLMIGLELHFDKSYTKAISMYKHIIESKKFETFDQPIYKSELYFSYGVSLQHYGEFNEANHQFFMAKNFNKFNLRALINLASIHHKYGDPDDASRHYIEAIKVLELKNLSIRWDLHAMTRTNYGINLLQKYKYDEANEQFSKTIDHLETLLQTDCTGLDFQLVNNVNSRETCENLLKTKSFTMHKVYTLYRASVYWKGWELLLDTLLQDTLHFAMKFIKHRNSEIIDRVIRKKYLDNEIITGKERKEKSFEGPFLPFDTLQADMSLSQRMLIADTYALNYHKTTVFDHVRRQKTHIDAIPSLKLGFLSYDFNEHPTARMIEGLFKNMPNNSRGNGKDLRNYISTVIISYSNDDDSEMTEVSKSMADAFVDIAPLGHNDATAEIRRLDLDILLDLQLFTLGNRAEIIARRPVPLQMSYLIFPGTSGASFIDSIVADYKVVPPEHARSYTEKIILMPTSYQISYYDRYSDIVDKELGKFPIDSTKFQLRKDNGLPVDPDVVVICNFNKLDKLDPKTFHIWMNIMSRVPKSYLWLMLPRLVEDGIDDLQVHRNLMTYAESHGISKDRIIFASRRNKASHIGRHYAADLFVDTFVYGAHSTATDALRGGLPVLTVNGDSFPNRVVASLYDSFQSMKMHSVSSFLDMLICDSVKEYEDLAVRLLTSRRDVLVAIRNQLLEHVQNKSGIFDAARTTVNFIKAMMTSHEMRWSTRANDDNFILKNSGFKRRTINLNNSFSISRPTEKVNSSLIKYHIVIT